MTLKVYNSLTKKKENFKPLKNKEVKMYVCGVTVYDDFHLGHAASAVAFDVIYRYLEYKGYKVKYVVNFTDVDDKMIARAKRENITIFELSEKYIKKYFQEIAALNIKRATVYPRATAHIKEIISLTQNLIDKGYAYEMKGDVNFSVNKFKTYGKLSHRSLEELVCGVRIKVDKRKHNPLDFALWKKAKVGEPSWNSPWGKGRPGWHIECSAMAMKYLGETLDIHGGGQDLLFPHHENEIAQSESFSGKPFVRYWLHNGLVTVKKEKMAKSSGNFFTVEEIIKNYEPEIVRFFLLSNHYRSTIDFDTEKLKEAKKGWERFANVFSNIKEILKKRKIKKKINGQKFDKREKNLYDFLKETALRFAEAMDDDFNTPRALASLYNLVHQINLFTNDKNFKINENALYLLNESNHILKSLGNILGLFGSEEEKLPDSLVDVLMKLIIEIREEARKQKNWELADKIREKLADLNIVLEDAPSKTKWKIFRKGLFAGVAQR